MKKMGSMILAIIMIFNIFITSANSNLVYANHNTYNQELIGKEVLPKVEKLLEEDSAEKTEEKNTEKSDLLMESKEDNLSQDTKQEKVDAKNDIITKIEAQLRDEGYVYSIKIHKESKEGTPLANAKFDIIRVATGVKVGTIATNSSGIGEFKGLLKDEYELKETYAPKGFEKLNEPIKIKISDFGTNKVAEKTIVNEPIKRTISVSKLWAGLQLQSCTVRLYADDKEIDSIVLNKDKKWKHTFTNLKKFNSEGKEIKYTVKEEIPKGYKAKYHGDMEKGFSIINTRDFTDITATKKWEGGPSEKPTVWFKLYRNIEAEEAKPVEELFEQPLNNGDTSVTWRGLPKTNDEGKEYIYSVKEGELKDGVFTEKAPKNYIKTENGLTVTNKYYSPKIDITGKKVWENEREKPTIKLQLFKNGQEEGNPVELKDGKTEHIWKNLPKTDKDGKDYEYTVKEVDEVNGHIKIENTWYKVTYEGNTQTGFTIKNKKLPPLISMEPPTREIKVTKLWKDHNGSTITAPTDKITVELYKDGVATGKKLELTKDNNWSGEFKKLEVADKLGSINYYNYTVKEVGENGNIIKLDTDQYKVIYGGSMKDGITITNEKETPPIPPTPEKPNNPTPQIPEKPNNPESPEKGKPTLPKTGDGTNLSAYAWAIPLSGIALMLIGYRRRKHAK